MKSVTLSKVAEPATLLKVTLLHGCFSRFYIVQIVPNRAKRHMSLQCHFKNAYFQHIPLR